MTEMNAEYAVVQTASPLVRRILARNPSPFTAQGTGTFIVGHGRVAVIDPGPDLPEHIAALLAALRGETIAHVLITHTHLDHSPATPAVKQATGARTYGYGPHMRADGSTSEEGADRAFTPDLRLTEGDVVGETDWHLRAVHTPGHTSNHLCYALEEEGILFTGDHVMGWSTTVISPPDGNMTDYMHSLEHLLQRKDTLYLPTHGPAIRQPHDHVRTLIEHRHRRHAAILHALREQPRSIRQIVDKIYIGLDPRLRAAAGQSVLAHLIEMKSTGEVVDDGAPHAETLYRAHD